MDPWTNPAFFDSWFPFPDNRDLDWDEIGNVDMLFISHTHQDHLDPKLLSRHVKKSATVLLPDYPNDELLEHLKSIGFRDILRIPKDRVIDVSGLSVSVEPLSSPSDGPIGDSVLWISDGCRTLLNQNDARPADLRRFTDLGPIDFHMLQYSGAIWWPVAYDLPRRAKSTLSATKRRRQFERALTYIRLADARVVIPAAGPPCFLDPELWHLNDLEGPSSTSVFPDQLAFLNWLEEQGCDRGKLLLPGSRTGIEDDVPVLSHLAEDFKLPFLEKKRYLIEMAKRRQNATHDEVVEICLEPDHVLAELKEWLEPLIALAPSVARGIGGTVRVILESTDRILDFVIDFMSGELRSFDRERSRHTFFLPWKYAGDLIRKREADWTNTLFLSMRFRVRRIGPYNEFVYGFFSALSSERIQYLEQWYAMQVEDSGSQELVRLGEWLVQRRCPHAGAELERFGSVDGEDLTCSMHGWRWRLASGVCVTAVASPLLATRSRDVG